MTHLLPSIAFDLAGYAGVVCYLGSYAALQSGMIRGNGYAYASLNLLAAVLILVSLTKQFNLSATIVQISYITISVVGMARFFLLTRAIRFSNEEADILSRKLPRLSKVSARRFLNLGLWTDAEAGTVLIREGESHGALIYLATGNADILSSDKYVGIVDAGNFLGEMTALEGIPATATVVLSEPARYFRVEADKLQRIGRRDAEFQLELENALSQDIRRKLVAANERMRAVDPS